MTNQQLKNWLRENSSGIYRPSSEAADVIEQLEKALKNCLLKMKLDLVQNFPIYEYSSTVKEGIKALGIPYDGKIENLKF